MRLFTEFVLPLIEAKKNKDEFKVCQIIRKNSPLLKAETLKKTKNQRDALRKVSHVVKDLFVLWDKGKDPSILEVLQRINDLSLFMIPESLEQILKKEVATSEESIDEYEKDKISNALLLSFASPFSQIKAYKSYISGESKFETHQGVKGLEYPRVMVIIDDSESKGFMFSYDKLFGAKELTPTDTKNIDSGKETSIDRTRRLFYVACSRAKESLAVIVYTDFPEIIKKGVLEKEWFDESEIEIIG